MSLKNFHRVFIVGAFGCCAFLAVWASGRNATQTAVPLVEYAAIAGMIALAPYSIWTFKHLR